MAKAAHWPGTDAEARKRGEQTGLDTLVVHAVNDECQPLVGLLTSGARVRNAWESALGFGITVGNDC